MKIEGKSILITGASSGIGESTAKTLSRKGGKLLLLARNKSKLERIAYTISEQGGYAAPFPVDLSDAYAIADVAKKIIAGFGIPDIVINNAGAGRWLTVEETASTDVEMMMAVPYFAAFNLTREFLPYMRTRGSGQIINISSVASRIAWPGAASYISARHALDGFTKVLRTELHGSGIHVTLATLGTINSTYWENNPGSRERLPRIDRFNRPLTVEQVAEAILKGIENDAREIIRPRIFRLIFILNAFFPKISERIMRM